MKGTHLSLHLSQFGFDSGTHMRQPATVTDIRRKLSIAQCIDIGQRWTRRMAARTKPCSIWARSRVGNKEIRHWAIEGVLLIFLRHQQRPFASSKSDTHISQNLTKLRFGASMGSLIHGQGIVD